MNVSRNAYFSSEYLEDLKRSPKSYNSNGTNRSTYRSRQNSPRTNYTRPSPRSTDSVVDKIDGIENPDDLMEEITPAELNYLSQRAPAREQRRLVGYYDYYRPRDGLRSPVKGALALNYTRRNHVIPGTMEDTESHEAMPGRGDFSGYYIDQKRKYDAAKEVKPAFYTHKTFKDVFKTDAEERLNPMDVVFEDPAKKREQNDRRVLSKALKKVSKTVGYDDYASYDYLNSQKNGSHEIKSAFC